MMSNKVAKSTCVLIGDELLLVQCGRALKERGHTIVAVISGSQQVAEWATREGLALLSPDSALTGALDSADYDWFLSIANLRLIPERIWRRAGRGAINFHDGPLPRYAGLNAPAWALLAGETQHGITWHLISDEVDGGECLVQIPVPIEAEDTALTLNAKCLEAGINGFAELLDQIESGELRRQPQRAASRTYFGKHLRPSAGATVDTSSTVLAADRLIRALSFGSGYANPLALPKILTRNGAYNLIDAVAVDGQLAPQPGRVLSVSLDEARIALADGVLVVRSLSDAAGAKVCLVQAFTNGDILPTLDADASKQLDGLLRTVVVNEDVFAKRLRSFEDVVLAGSRPAESDVPADISAIEVECRPIDAGDRGVAGVIGYFLRTSGREAIHVVWADDRLAADAVAWRGYIAPTVPLMIAAAASVDGEALARGVAEELGKLKSWRGYAADLVSRLGNVGGLQPSVGIRLTDDPASAELLQGTAVTIVVSSQAGTPRILFDKRRLPADEASALSRRMAVFMDAFSAAPSAAVADLPLMSPDERDAVVVAANRTARPYDNGALVHTLVGAQVERTPDAIALACDGEELTYAQLDQRSNQVAAALRGAGAKPDDIIGLYMRRSADLVVGVLAILKCGGAYLPLDPSYPSDRIALMIADSGCPIVLTTDDLLSDVPDKSPRLLTIEVASRVEAAVIEPVAQDSATLAYVIYTSGSTGHPKGVMVEHRNVVNFFAGMDDRIPVATSPQPVWLAVTSLSFDISVLELLWTLTRGFKVVVHTETPAAQKNKARRARSKTAGAMEFGLFYWGNDDGPGPKKYQLLLEGARFADRSGFSAVWVPERHFHAFGGPYPNPSVAAAAVAAVTSNIDIRAGSCVLPLHHIARVAEEWAVVDNLSNGRVGIAAAPGWMPEDFVLRPQNAPPHNKAALRRDIEILRRLWRGESVGFEGPGGTMIDVVTLPRPVQRELPVWLTIAGNPESFRDAARCGAHVLTHLLGQSIAEVGENIRIYRETLVECGRNPADFKVTLMLHTLIGQDREEVRELARGPMKAYLRSAAGLIKQYAWAFPAFKKPKGVSQPNEVDLQSLAEDEFDAIIEFAFLRYFDDSGLFGTVENALDRVSQVKAIGVDEIGCLIDFGVPQSKALAALEFLAEVVATAGSSLSDTKPAEDGSIGGLIRSHGVTHLQFTPAMAAMVLANDEDRAALAGIRHLFIGGEALQGALLREIAAATQASVLNMYGPTETTIWSSTCLAEPTDGTVPLGTPIANTQLYILDDRLRPLPAGMPGELFIGGDGVTRGYLNREELTRERFLANPFVPGGRMYRTGDLVRRSPEGVLQFLGRVDFQVKVRGYRIELGEIEACLRMHPAIAEAVVVAREDKPGDVRIVAYVRHSGDKVPEQALLDHVRATLPDYMTPAHFVTMEKFPLTPNAKIDRNALPKPGAAQQVVVSVTEHVAPNDEVEIRIAEAFKRALGLEKVSTLDNFFTLGGHSLLAVQVHRELKKSVSSSLSITDIYRFPTVGGLAAHILNRGQASEKLDRVANRAAMRRTAMAARRPARHG